MKNLISKLLILSILFAGSLHAVAGDTITYVNRGSLIAFAITATLDKQFTVRSVDQSINQTFTGTGELQTVTIISSGYDNREIIIEGEKDCAFILFVPVASTISADFSKCPSIENIHIKGLDLESINLSNCVNLEVLHVSEPFLGGRLKNLDLSDCRALENIFCDNLQLSVLDMSLSNNPAIATGQIHCKENYLSLSNLYALSELIPISNNKVFGRQTLATRRVLLGDPVDYSSQKEFGGMATDFYVMNGAVTGGFFLDVFTLAHPSEYTVNDGVITFHRQGNYTVDMRNLEIKADETQEPTRVLAYIQVIDFVPVTEITNIPASTTVGTPVYLSNRVILPNNATYTLITWKISDAGTTGATLTGTRLNTTAPGTVVVNATIKDGLAFGVDYTQDFVIKVNPLSIDESELSMIELYPNPTTGEFSVFSFQFPVECIEIFDVYGRIQQSKIVNRKSEIVTNISHLQSGIYFVKITTEQGEIVKKVVKQ